MNILIISSSILTNFDGKSIRLLKYASLLKSLDHKVTFIVLKNSIPNFDYDVIEVNTVLPDHMGQMKYIPFYSEFLNVIYLLKFGLVVLNSILSSNYSYVISSLTSPEIASLFAILGCKLTSSKHIFDYDDLAPEMSMIMKGWSKSHIMYKLHLVIERIICSGSYVVISMSNTMTKKISRSVSISKIVTIYNAPIFADIIQSPILSTRAALNYEQSKFLFCYVGSVQRKIRSLEVIVDAVELLSKRRSDFKMCIIGDGSGLPLFKKNVLLKGLSDFFYFTGKIDKDETIAYVNASNGSFVLLPPSELGDYMAPGKLFVSMGLGKNIIATKHVEIEHILNDQAFYVPTCPTKVDLAGTMNQMINTIEIDEINTELIDEFCRSYNWDVEKIKFIDLMEGGTD